MQRYIRLTYLRPKLLEYVDEGRIAITPAGELSYLNDIEQQDLILIPESSVIVMAVHNIADMIFFIEFHLIILLSLERQRQVLY